ncbi:MAG: DUF7033 domain-containing protein [Flavobacteriales bacterium]
MLLIYTPKITTRITYVFKHIFTRIIGIKIDFTSVIETFIAHQGPKLSYAKKPLGNELFFQSHELLLQQGIESVEIRCKKWGETVGFFKVSEQSTLPFDIFAASFYLLSRYEEYLPHVKDPEGRFPASESLAYKENFLETPIIDIWAALLKQKLKNHFIDIEFTHKNFVLHNLVEAKSPFLYKHKGFLYSFIGFLKDIFRLKFISFYKRARCLLGFKKDPHNVFSWIIEKSNYKINQLTVFFLLGNENNYNEGINFQKEQFRMLIKYVGDYVSIGQIFSTNSINNLDDLKKEKIQLENITNRKLLDVTNAKQYINLPEYYRFLIELEIQTDFTMYYDNNIGFRAGTCTPFLFYDLDFEIKTPLIIHPIVASTTVFDIEKPSNLLPPIQTIYSKVKELDGVFSIFFKNINFNDDKHNKFFKMLFTKFLA